jgi:hypothetical protein
MKITKNSKQLMLFFTKNKYIKKVNQTKRTDSILLQLYKDILNAYFDLNNIKSLSKTQNYYRFHIKKINNPSQIIKPKNFGANSFPEIVRKHIDNMSLTELTYIFSLYGRNIKIHFITEEDNPDIDLYNKYVDAIYMWIYILSNYASKSCSNSLVVYLYFTSLEKVLPSSNIEVLNEINVNTAFTTTCPKDSEIVVFRKEEWFKVFIHETFHNFGLDFSDMNNSDAHKCILDLFKVKSNVNLYESYTEFWAEIMNALFCSFYILKDKRDEDQFLSNSEFFINFERTYSYFQLVKALDFMGLTYKDLYSKTERSKVNRENLYKEKTNVLSYYVIKAVLINNYQGFLNWCNLNNDSLIQFKKTSLNQEEYCQFIKNNYKTASMIENISETQSFLDHVQRKGKKSDLTYILSNLRMSICELG